MRRRHALAVITLWISAGVVGGCAGATSGLSITTTTPNGTSEQIPATLSKPDGPGPFPAVVIMHDCGGLRPRPSGAPRRRAKGLLWRSYVTALPGSFSPRRHPDG